MTLRILTYAETFAARVIGAAGVMTTAIFTARFLSADDRGKFFYIMTLATVTMQIASLGIFASNTFVVAKQPEMLGRALTNSLWIAAVGGVATGFIVIAVDGFFNHSAGELWPWVAIAAALGPIMLAFFYLSSMALGILRPRLFNFLTIFSGFAGMVAAAVASFIAPTVGGFLIAALIAAALGAVVAIIALTRGVRLPLAFDVGLFRQSIGFALRAYFAIMFGFLMARTGVIILRNVDTFDAVGQWSIATQISDGLLMLPGVVALLIYPTMVRAEPAARWADFKSVFIRVGALMCALCIGIGLVARPIIHFVFGPVYDSAVPLLIAMLPGVVALSMTTICSQYLSAYGIPRLQVLAWLGACLLQIALSLYLAKPYGALGLAWIQSLCAIIVCLSLMALSARQRFARPSQAEQ